MKKLLVGLVLCLFAVSAQVQMQNEAQAADVVISITVPDTNNYVSRFAAMVNDVWMGTPSCPDEENYGTCSVAPEEGEYATKTDCEANEGVWTPDESVLTVKECGKKMIFVEPAKAMLQDYELQAVRATKAAEADASVSPMVIN